MPFTFNEELSHGLSHSDAVVRYYFDFTRVIWIDIVYYQNRRTVAQVFDLEFLRWNNFFTVLEPFDFRFGMSDHFDFELNHLLVL